MVYGTNLIYSAARPGGRPSRAIQKLDLLVDHRRAARRRSPAGATWCCPSRTYLERYDDLWAAAYKQPFVALRQPVVAADVRLEARLVDRARARQAASGSARTSPGRTADGVPAGAREGGRLRLRASCSRPAWCSASARPTCEEEGLKLAFGTDSEKIELSSAALADGGLRPAARVHPARGAAAGHVPAALRPRADAHLRRAPATTASSASATPENEVWINATAARALAGFEEAAADGRPGDAGQPGRASSRGPVKVQGHRAHPRRLRLPGARLGAHGPGPALRPRPGRLRQRARRPATRSTRSWAAPA